MQTFDRRHLFRLGSASTGALLLGNLARPSRARAQESEPHFFLHVFFPGGMDATYSFDARPLEMTAAGLQVNFGGHAPILHKGSNGQNTWISPHVEPMRAHLRDLAIINGVVMMPAFDGHDQNVGFLLTGNPFSGEVIMPHLNEGATKLPLDYVQVGEGNLLTTITNADNAVPLTAASAKSFSDRLKQLPPLAAASPLKTFLFNRMLVNGAGNGKHSAGSRAMAEAFTRMPPLAESLKDMRIDENEPDDIAKITGLVTELFRGNVCKSALLIFDTDLNPEQELDTHDSQTAAEMPKLMKKLMGQLSNIFDALKNTPYDDRRSLFDVTTVLVGTEFGRTMRQMSGDVPLEFSGTDHNPLTNTILLAGKGIKGGRIFGQSDFQTSKEVLSPAHLGQDPLKVKIMGRPFDFAQGRPRTDLPKVYKTSDYLTFSSVANTIYKLFGAKPEHLRLLERNGPPAKTLDGLLLSS